MLITPSFVRSSFLLKVIVLSTNADYPIVCPFVLYCSLDISSKYWWMMNIYILFQRVFNLEQ